MTRDAKDRAARVAEQLLTGRNDDWERAFALDVLNAYVSDVKLGRHGGLAFPAHRLAWALGIVGKRTDLEPHERKLLELAWEKAEQDSIDKQWEEMGL